MLGPVRKAADPAVRGAADLRQLDETVTQPFYVDLHRHGATSVLISGSPLRCGHAAHGYALMIPRLEASKQVPRPLTCAGIPDLAETVPGDVQREHRHGDRDPGPKREPRRLAQVLLRGVEHGAPRRRGRLGAEAEEAQGRLGDDGA